METIAIAVYASSFIKELQQSTSGKPGAWPAEPEPTPDAGGPGLIARVASAAGTVHSWLRSLRWRLAA